MSDTDAFAARVGPVASEPEVQALFSRQLADQVTTAVVDDGVAPRVTGAIDELSAPEPVTGLLRDLAASLGAATSPSRCCGSRRRGSSRWSGSSSACAWPWASAASGIADPLAQDGARAVVATLTSSLVRNGTVVGLLLIGVLAVSACLAARRRLSRLAGEAPEPGAPGPAAPAAAG